MNKAKKESFIRRLKALGSTAVVLAGIGTTTFFGISSAYTHNQKKYSQILQDADSCDINLEVANNLAKQIYCNTIFRLKMNEESPVIVKCADNLTQKEVDMIEQITEYYNFIFSTINKNYKFEVKKEGEEIPFNSTIITYKNKNIKETALGETLPFPFLGGTGNNFIANATIFIDWNKIKDEDDAVIYHVLFHEFTHILGLGDVYYQGYHKNSSSINIETIMNTDNLNTGINYLYPNDYAILQALYSNEYKKHDSYADAVEVVNKKIDTYTKLFYQNYSKYLKEKLDVAKDLSISKFLKEEISWISQNSNYYKIKLYDNRTCELIITDKNGRILEKSNGKWLLNNGILHIRQLQIENANNYLSSYNENLKMNLQLSVYINENGSVGIYDGFNSWSNIQLNHATKPR